MGSVVPEKILVNHNCYPLPTFFISVDSKGTLSCFRMNTSGSVHSKRVRGAFSAFRRHFPVSVDCKRVSGRKQRNCALIETAANGQGNISPSRRIPSIYIVLYTKNYQKSMTIFGRERGEGGRMLQDKENEGFIDAIKELDKHALNMYTALRAGLGTRELSWIRLGFRDLQANGNAKRFQEEWRQ